MQRARLRHAESLLVDTDLKLDVIAREVGFRSRSHFSEYFRNVTGEPPSAFRARRR
jgi:transcriptional regulator GlxA family with amidase domain